jgi:hydroxymethylpyrimidine pyrophosphatase-like HAD family hydrolase
MPAQVVQALVSDLVDVAPSLQIALQFADEYHSFRLPMDAASLANWGFSQEELLPFPEASQRACTKIVALHETLSLCHAYRDMRVRYADRANVFLTDDDHWMQLVSVQASKEHAISDLLAQRGIGPERVIVFGDDLPDRGMFTTFGCAVAMGNAPNALKEAAMHVTRSNDEDGIAFALYEILRIL